MSTSSILVCMPCCRSGIVMCKFWRDLLPLCASFGATCCRSVQVLARLAAVMCKFWRDLLPFFNNYVYVFAGADMYMYKDLHTFSALIAGCVCVYYV